MKDGNEPKQANEKMKPEQLQGEEFGDIHGAQRKGNRIPERNDTPRGSEPEQRGTSGPRS
jgi:hypothetical protein